MSIWFNNNGTKREATYLKTDSSKEVLLGLLNPFSTTWYDPPQSYYNFASGKQPTFKYLDSASIPMWASYITTGTPASYLTTNTQFTVLAAETTFTITKGHWVKIKINSSTYWTVLPFNLAAAGNSSASLVSASSTIPSSSSDRTLYQISDATQVTDYESALQCFYVYPTELLKAFAIVIDRMSSDFAYYCKDGICDYVQFHVKITGTTSTTKVYDEPDVLANSSTIPSSITNGKVVLVTQKWQNGSGGSGDSHAYYYISEIGKWIQDTYCTSIPTYTNESTAWKRSIHGSITTKIAVTAYKEPHTSTISPTNIAGTIAAGTSFDLSNDTFIGSSYNNGWLYLYAGSLRWVWVQLNSTNFTMSSMGWADTAPSNFVWWTKWRTLNLADYKSKHFFTYSSKNRRISITSSGSMNRGTVPPNPSNNCNGLALDGSYYILNKKNEYFELSDTRTLNVILKDLWKFKINSLSASSVNGWYWSPVAVGFGNPNDNSSNSTSVSYPAGNYPSRMGGFSCGGILGGGFSSGTASLNGVNLPVVIINKIKCKSTDKFFKINNLYQYCFDAPANMTWDSFINSMHTYTYPSSSTHNLYNASGHFAITSDNYVTYNDDVFLGSGTFYVYNGASKVTKNQKILEQNYTVKA